VAELKSEVAARQLQLLQGSLECHAIVGINCLPVAKAGLLQIQ